MSSSLVSPRAAPPDPGGDPKMVVHRSIPTQQCTRPVGAAFRPDAARERRRSAGRPLAYVRIGSQRQLAAVPAQYHAQSYRHAALHHSLAEPLRMDLAKGELTTGTTFKLTSVVTRKRLLMLASSAQSSGDDDGKDASDRVAALTSTTKVI